MFRKLKTLLLCLPKNIPRWTFLHGSKINPDPDNGLRKMKRVYCYNPTQASKHIFRVIQKVCRALAFDE